MPKTLPNIKACILQTTREMITEKGYNQLCIRNIAKRCGIATGTFYNYFRSKQEIVSSLLSEDWDRMADLVKKHMRSRKPPIERLEDLYRELEQMMYSVHSLWAEGLPEDMRSETIGKLQMMKRDIWLQFKRFILEVVSGHTETGREEAAADLITHLFFSYSYERSDFAPLRWILEKIII
jgi:AcrR family transcriptional regulator